MEAFKESILILYSTPIYAVIIGLEMLMSYIHEKRYYTVKDTATNVYLSALNFGLDIVMRGVCLFILAFFNELSFFTIENIYLYWIALFILQDLAFYWEHRFDHTSRFFWAVHVTHHSSQEFNLTTGFRSSVFQPLYRYIYFVPIALLGFKGTDIMFVYAATQIYGILIHTRYINKMGFLEHILVTPSHHRVHHASNIKYLDKNMGMVLIIWDKLFGTFQKEENEKEYEPIRYGLTSNIDKPHHPGKIVFHEWNSILQDVKKPVPFLVKLKYIFAPPGWSHDGSRKTSSQLRKEAGFEK